MTRFLSRVLGAQEPDFGKSIELLEQASGLPSADIRLSAAVANTVRAKIAQLGLDPHDTTGPELYAALQSRVARDEQVVREALDIPPNSNAQVIVSTIAKMLADETRHQTCFGVKITAIKKILKRHPPKATMKILGYRSLDSLLKHEPIPLVISTAQLLESNTWKTVFLNSYSAFGLADFEQRKITVVYPTARRWNKVAELLVARNRHNVVCLKELGSLVVLPLEADLDALALLTLIFGLDHINDIRTFSFYAKLRQMRPDFGKTIRQVVRTGPMTGVHIAGQPVSWRMIQQFYGRFPHLYRAEIFEPHIQQEDLQWKHAEDILASLHPQLAFWRDTQTLALLHDDKPVSMNIFDAAINRCNKLSFADRAVHFVRDRVWHELMAGYLNHGNLETMLANQVSSTLAETT
jgi:hypothetical protein